ncbi:hypothetical protein SUDANB145_06750 [Streptomyces sp. enrichment culture]
MDAADGEGPGAAAARLTGRAVTGERRRSAGPAGVTLDAYHGAAPLAAGRRERVGVHQLFPLPVHAVPFGRGYAEQAVAVAPRR